MNACRFAFAVMVAVTVTHLAIAQGPLNPPGAPAPTMKSLDQIDGKLDQVTTNQTAADAKLEKRIDVLTLPGDAGAQHIISQSGSYYLGGNITGNGITAISIRASNVTVDLNGFTIDGNDAAGDGIGESGTLSGIAIRNGIIRRWSGSGIALAGADNGRYEHLQVLNNGAGITVDIGSAISHCTVANNTGPGITAGARSTVADSQVLDNSGVGVALATLARINRCTVRGNGGNGVTVNTGSTIHDSAIFSNLGPFGILAQAGTTVSDCSVGFNGSTSTEAIGFGISVGAGSVVVNCTSIQNSSVAGTSTGTTGGGIFAASGSTIKNCTATSNEGDGISVAGDCLVTGNTSGSNGNNGDGAGISATGNDNRIDGNNVTENDRGILIALGDGQNTGNLVVRNSASGNGAGNYVITAQNRFGPVVDLTGAQPSTVNGNTAGSTVGTTDPWANFAY